MTSTDSINIRPATADDAPLIAYVVMTAIGDELCDELGCNTSREAVFEVFLQLAQSDEAQYSYRNTLIAEDSVTGQPVGAIIAYDGAEVAAKRHLLFNLAEERLGLHFPQETPLESIPGEIYIDSLAVLPMYRGRGIAGRLIKAVTDNPQRHMPVSLLVSKDNDKARRLYESLGFRFKEERPFAGEMMDCLQFE